jgi:hypothetical protein
VCVSVSRSLVLKRFSRVYVAQNAALRLIQIDFAVRSPVVLLITGRGMTRISAVRPVRDRQAASTRYAAPG